LQAVRDRFRDDPDVAFVAIQTVFEGYASNTFERGREVMAKFGLEDVPMGQSGGPGEPSKFMRRYRTGGTPWTVVVAPDGSVVWDGFHIGSSDAVALIERLSQKARSEQGTSSP